MTALVESFRGPSEEVCDRVFAKRTTGHATVGSHSEAYWQDGSGRPVTGWIPVSRKDQMILITGASGFVGRHLTAALAHRAQSEGLRLLDVRPFPESLPTGAEAIVGSIEQPVDVAIAVRNVETIVHLAANVQPTSTDLDGMVRTNTIGTRNMFVAAVAAGCKHFVHISSAGIYGLPRGIAALQEADAARPVSPYQRTKWDAEEILRSVDPGCTALNIIRPTGVYGAGSHLELSRYRRLLRRHWSVALEGGMLVSPIHVSDLAAAIAALVAAPAKHGTVFNVGGERAIRIDELDDLVARSLGVPHRRLVIPAWLAEPLARLLGPVLAAIGRPDPLLRTYARGQDVSSVLDDSSFRQSFPGLSRKPIESGLREQLEWARSERLL